MARKRISKKNKSSWRKHSSAKDVQTLEDNIQSLQSNSSIFEKFVLDSCAANEPKQIKKTGKTGNTRSESVIEPVTISKPSKTRPKLNIKRLLRSKEAAEKTKSKKIETIDYDVWTVPESEKGAANADRKPPIDPKTEWISPKAQLAYELQTSDGGYRKKIPSTIRQKTSNLPAVEIPHPGISYNPSLKDHLDLLNIVDNKIQKIRKENKRLNNNVSQIVRKVNTKKLQKIQMEEMAEGLSFDKKIEATEAESDSEYTAVNAPVVNRPKDVKKRKKQAERKKLAREKMLEFKERRKLNELKKLDKIKRELDEKEAYLKQRHENRQKKRKEKRLTTVKRLGPVKFIEPLPEYNRPQDLAGSLRAAKVEGSLLARQYTQLQKRNMIKPSRVQFKKTPKRKSYVRAEDKIPASEELKYL